MQPLPEWKNLPAHKIRANYRAIERELEAEAHELRRKSGVKSIGPARIRAQNPMYVPESTNRSPAIGRYAQRPTNLMSRIRLDMLPTSPVRICDMSGHGRMRSGQIVTEHAIWAVSYPNIGHRQRWSDLRNHEPECGPIGARIGGSKGGLGVMECRGDRDGAMGILSESVLIEGVGDAGRFGVGHRTNGGDDTVGADADEGLGQPHAAGGRVGRGSAGLAPRKDHALGDLGQGKHIADGQAGAIG